MFDIVKVVVKDSSWWKTNQRKQVIDKILRSAKKLKW